MGLLFETARPVGTEKMIEGRVRMTLCICDLVCQHIFWWNAVYEYSGMITPNVFKMAKTEKWPVSLSWTICFVISFGNLKRWHDCIETGYFMVKYVQHGQERSSCEMLLKTILQLILSTFNITQDIISIALQFPTHYRANTLLLI